MSKRIQRPVTVRIEEYKKDLQSATLRSELPPFMLEMILGEYLSGISIVARREYDQERMEWDKKCSEDERMEADE